MSDVGTKNAMPPFLQHIQRNVTAYNTQCRVSKWSRAYIAKRLIQWLFRYV